MKIKIADYLIKQLNKLGIEEIFGLPGDFNFEIVEAVENNKNVNWIGSTNELNAGYSADGYARIKGYGAIITTYGVGELSAINAIAGCMSENVPVIQITGVPATKFIENNTLLHHNLSDANYHAFLKAYSNVVEATAFLNKENAKSEIDRLINTMIKTKKPVYLAIPMDICGYEIEDDESSFIIPKSNPATLNEVVNLIIEEIKKAQKPCFIADILSKRFSAKNAVNNFLSKTNIPSCAFLRGNDIIDNKIKNYLGIFSGKIYNDTLYRYLYDSDCIIIAGGVLSDLNTMGFSYNFKLEDTINIQPYYTEIKGKRYENILIADILEELYKKITYTSNENIVKQFGYKKTNTESLEPLSAKYIYPRLNEFFKENDIIITEVGLVPFGVLPMELPFNINIENQVLWGSIGWATPCAQGCAMADRKRRTILITGDGAHQLTAQEISTMMRNDIKPIIFVINNSGYTVERILCDDVEYKYNDIASWNYSMLPKVFKGDCFCGEAKTNVELNEILNEIEKIDGKRMCYIELHCAYLDVPFAAKGIAKHPELLN